MKYHYPPEFHRILLSGLAEILGRHDLNAILETSQVPKLAHPGQLPQQSQPLPDTALSFQALSSILSAVETFHGPQAGRGLNCRVGRACFKHALRTFGPSLGLTTLSFRLLPLHKKIPHAAHALAQFLTVHTDQPLMVIEGKNELLLQTERCGICWQRQTHHAICHFAVGFLQEALYWISGGKQFLVTEASCLAMGAPHCQFTIHLQPIG